MKLIIDIYDSDYEDIQKYGTVIDEDRDDIADAIKNGIPLDDIKNEIPTLSHWQSDDGQDLAMVADVLECIDKHTGKERVNENKNNRD